MGPEPSDSGKERVRVRMRQSARSFNGAGTVRFRKGNLGAGLSSELTLLRQPRDFAGAR